MSQATGGSFLLEEVGDRPIFLPEQLSDEQKQFAELVKDFVINEVMPKGEEIEAKDFHVTVPLLKKAGELGILAAEIPEEFGGMGIDKVTMVAMGENAVLQGSFGVSMMCHTGIGSWPIMYFGNPEQKKRYLPKLATGELIGAYCLTEPGSGSDALGLKTKAVLSPDGKHWILNGEKTFITNGGFADVFTVFAKVDGTQVTAFIVDKGSEGLSIGKEEKKMGIHGSSTTPVIMENCQVPKENLLGEIGKGHKIAFNCLNLGRFKLGIGATGGSKYYVGKAVQYANERKQFGKSITEFGLIRKKLADMTIRTFVSEGMNYRTAALMDTQISHLDKKAGDYTQQVMDVVEEFALESSVAKIYGSECIDYVIDEGLQILGGYGFLEEYPFAAAYRNIRINRIFEGTNEINRLLIPVMLFKKAMKGELPLMETIQAILGELKTGWSKGKLPKDEHGSLPDEVFQVKLAKKIAIYTAGVAAQKYMEKLRDKQYIAEFMADMVIDAYAMDTTVARVLQLIQSRGEAKCDVVKAIARTFVNETYQAMLSRARRMLSAVAEGNQDEYGRYAKALSRFDYFVPLDTTATRETIAHRIIEKQEYNVV